MKIFSIILLAISFFMILEGLIILVFPNLIRKSLKELTKNKKLTQKIGLIELIIGLVLLVTSWFFNLFFLFHIRK